MKIVVKLLLVCVLALITGLAQSAQKDKSLSKALVRCAAKDKSETKKPFSEQGLVAHEIAGALLDKLPAPLSRIVLGYAKEDASYTIDLTEFLKDIGSRKGYKAGVEFLISRMQLLNNGLINIFVHATQPAAMHALHSVECTMNGTVRGTNYVSKKVNAEKKPVGLPSLAFNCSGGVYEARVVKPVVLTIRSCDIERIEQALLLHHTIQAPHKGQNSALVVAQ